MKIFTGFSILVFVLVFDFSVGTQAAVAPAKQLDQIRSSILNLEKDLIVESRGRKKAVSQVKKLRRLIKLQRKEKELSHARLRELESYIGELEKRKRVLEEKIRHQKGSMRKLLMQIEHSARAFPLQFPLPRSEVIEAPRRRVLSRLASRARKKIEALRIDMADADHLLAQIWMEKQHVVYLFQDLREQESLLEFHKKLQLEVLRKNYKNRLSALKSYRELKESESQVENLIRQFNARVEFERIEEVERQAAKSMLNGVFSSLKGKLPKPVKGKIVSGFGRAFDSKSRLHVFRKGIEIAAAPGASVKAVSSGRVVYSGMIPRYGRVSIVDHGDHYYSLYAGLEENRKKKGEFVAAGAPLGVADKKGKPIYFEIRSRNVAVNPLQWLLN